MALSPRWISDHEVGAACGGARTAAGRPGWPGPRAEWAARARRPGASGRPAVRYACPGWPGTAWSPAKPVRSRRCPATVMPRTVMPAGDEPGRLAHADVLSSAEGRFVRCPGRGPAAALASSGPTEDDHAVSRPPRPGPRGVRRAHRVRCRLRHPGQQHQRHVRQRRVRPPGSQGFPVIRGRGQRHGEGHVPADRDRVALPHRDRDAVRDRRRKPGQGGGLAVGLPAAGAADQAVRLPAQRGGDRRGKAGPGGGVG